MTAKIRIVLTLLWLPLIAAFYWDSRSRGYDAFVIRQADAPFQNTAEQIQAVATRTLSMQGEIVALLYLLLVVAVAIWCKLISLER